MDRQALLEKKRQRLLELQQRRAGVHAAGSIEELLPVPESVSVKVDFGVQVDLLPTQSKEVHRPIPIQHNLDVLRFDKGVQTNFEDVETETVQHKEEIEEVKEVEVEAELPPSQQVEDALKDQFEQLGLRFSDLRLGLKQESAQTLDNSDVPFKEVHGISKFLERPVVAVATTKRFPNILLVAYGRPRAKQPRLSVLSLPGLAVIFNRDPKDSPVPEFFLQCISPISTIIFDEADPFRVIAGLSNGRLVMWDLTSVKPTQIAILPTLQSSTLVSSAEKNHRKFIRHVSPIIFLQQLDADKSSVISICSEGVINVWSTNLLAFPKLASVRVAAESSSLQRLLALNSAVLVQSIFHHSDAGASQSSPEFRFLKQIALGSINGTIYRTWNNKEKLYVRSALLPESGRAGGVTALVELKHDATESLLLSAHLDWNLRLWNYNDDLLHTIPTFTIVTSISLRPNHWSQFVTVGSVKPPEACICIEFWDLQVRLMGPVLSIPVSGTQSLLAVAHFNHDGSELMVALDRGDVVVWAVDEAVLDARLEQSAFEGGVTLLSDI